MNFYDELKMEGKEDMRENRLKAGHSIFGFIIGTVTSYLLLSSQYVSRESAFMLVIFNFLYVSLTFPLNGTLTKKVCMLILGNIIGLSWNYLFYLFATNTAGYFGKIFDTLHVISPFLNLIWIVSFWSISMTILANSKSNNAGL